ncbi:MAG: hypothetical protein M0Z87_06600 [Actinomycetota bacterium]|nr:hypothetical protein [Actinomycetota bacterium]
MTGRPASVQRLQPFEARKLYLCPGCNHDIVPGQGHVVVVPRGAADMRRHWHDSCWDRRHTRRAGRIGRRL